jgi:hypothetical protein
LDSNFKRCEIWNNENQQLELDAKRLQFENVPIENHWVTGYVPTPIEIYDLEEQCTK